MKEHAASGHNLPNNISEARKKRKRQKLMKEEKRKKLFKRRKGDKDRIIYELFGKGKGKKGKKKRKIKHMMKYFSIAAVIFLKLTLLFKFFNAAVKAKFLVIALLSISMHFIQFWLNVKKGYNPPKIFYYEGGHHPHIGADRRWDRGDGTNVIMNNLTQYPSRRILVGSETEKE